MRRVLRKLVGHGPVAKLRHPLRADHVRRFVDAPRRLRDIPDAAQIGRGIEPFDGDAGLRKIFECRQPRWPRPDHAKRLRAVEDLLAVAGYWVIVKGTGGHWS